MTENAVATIPQKRSIIAELSSKYGLEPSIFQKTVQLTCMPSTATNEEFVAFLMVCRTYNLNPILREIYAFPKKGGGIVPIVSLDGWVNLINSRPELDGIEFVEHARQGELEAITCRIWRKDRSRPVEVTEYLSECYRATDPWKMKHRMLRHKALIQAARYAFGFSGIHDEDEGERFASSEPPRAPIAASDAPRLAAIEPAGSISHAGPAGLPFDIDDFLDELRGELEEATTTEEVTAIDAEFSARKPGPTTQREWQRYNTAVQFAYDQLQQDEAPSITVDPETGEITDPPLEEERASETFESADQYIGVTQAKIQQAHDEAAATALGQFWADTIAERQRLQIPMATVHDLSRSIRAKRVEFAPKEPS